MPEPLLSARGLTKRFQGVDALVGVDLTLYPGEIQALMGENGAGKSTLIKVLTGVLRADAGLMELQGKSILPHSPMEAAHLGISTVYQEVNLLPNLSIAENVVLGREGSGALGIRWKSLRERAVRALERVDLHLDVQRSLGSLSIAQQQLVAIARALDIQAKILILDEPTSSLDTHEVEQLFRVMTDLKSKGLAILFVTHFLDQVYAVSDRITVLRNGHLVVSAPSADMPRMKLVEHMVGRPVEEAPARSPGVPGETMLDIRGLETATGLQGITLQVREGEVVGLAGLLGSGRTEILRYIFGLDKGKATSGLGRWSVRRAMKKRFALCPEDRKAAGIIPDLGVRENIVLALQSRSGWFRKLPLSAQRTLATEYVQKLRIATPDLEKPVKDLSGGNQQKVLLARWLLTNPKLLLLDEPTRGIDIGAKEEIMRLIEALREEGLGIVLVTSELTETLRACDRVVCLHDRRMSAELAGEQVTSETILQSIAGGSP